MTTTETRLHDLGYRGVSVPALAPLGRTEALADAARLGTAAFARAHREGRSIAPAQDVEMGKLIKRQQGDAKAVIALLDAFNKAYIAANLAQSVEKPSKLQWAREGIRGFTETANKNKAGTPEYARALVMLLARLDSLSLTLRSDYYEAEPEEMTPENVREARDILAAGDALAEFLRGSVPVVAMEANKDAAPRLSAWTQMSKGARELLREVKLLQDGKRSVADRLDGLPGYIEVVRPGVFDARLKLMAAPGTVQGGPEDYRVVRTEISFGVGARGPGSIRTDTLAFPTRAAAVAAIEQAVGDAELWKGLEELGATMLNRERKAKAQDQQADFADLDVDVERALIAAIDAPRQADLRKESARLLRIALATKDPWSRALIEAGTFYVPGLDTTMPRARTSPEVFAFYAADKAARALGTKIPRLDGPGTPTPLDVPHLLTHPIVQSGITHRTMDPKALHLPEAWEEMGYVTPWQVEAKGVLGAYETERKKTAANMKVKPNTKAWAEKLKENAGSVGGYLVQVAKIRMGHEKEAIEKKRQRIKETADQAIRVLGTREEDVETLRKFLHKLGVPDAQLPPAGTPEVDQVRQWRAAQLEDLKQQDWMASSTPRRLVTLLLDPTRWTVDESGNLDSMDSDQMKLITELRTAGVHIGLPG